MNVCHLTRGELLDWLNTFLGTTYTKVEETCNGAAYCQVFDAIFPGSVRLSRVDFNASSEQEMISNYKILQSAFSKKNIEKQIDVESLVKGKCMASLEMLQWIKQFFDTNYNGGEYDGPGRRAKCKCKGPGGTKNTGSSRTIGQVSFSHTKVTSTPRRMIKNTAEQPIESAVKTKPAKTPMKPIMKRNEPMSAVKPKVTKARPSMTPAVKTQKKQVSSLDEIRKLKEQLEKMEMDNQILFREREFYYNKLRKVEDMCQNNSENEFSSGILKILYETDEDNGFIAPDDLEI